MPLNDWLRDPQDPDYRIKDVNALVRQVIKDVSAGLATPMWTFPAPGDIEYSGAYWRAEHDYMLSDLTYNGFPGSGDTDLSVWVDDSGPVDTVTLSGFFDSANHSDLEIEVPAGSYLNPSIDDSSGDGGVITVHARLYRLE